MPTLNTSEVDSLRAEVARLKQGEGGALQTLQDQVRRLSEENASLKKQLEERADRANEGIAYR